jgi:hypothetical protein
LFDLEAPELKDLMTRCREGYWKDPWFTKASNTDDLEAKVVRAGASWEHETLKKNKFERQAIGAIS